MMTSTPKPYRAHVSLAMLFFKFDISSTETLTLYLEPRKVEDEIFQSLVKYCPDQDRGSLDLLEDQSTVPEDIPLSCERKAPFCKACMLINFSSSLSSRCKMGNLVLAELR